MHENIEVDIDGNLPNSLQVFLNHMLLNIKMHIICHLNFGAGFKILIFLFSSKNGTSLLYLNLKMMKANLFSGWRWMVTFTVRSKILNLRLLKMWKSGRVTLTQIMPEPELTNFEWFLSTKEMIKTSNLNTVIEIGACE